MHHDGLYTTGESIISKCKQRTSWKTWSTTYPLRRKGSPRFIKTKGLSLMKKARKVMFFSLFFVGATLWMACNPITRENFGEQMWNTYCSFVHEKCCKEKTLADATKQLFGESMDECLKKYGETIDFGGLFKINFKETYDKIANSEDVDFKTENAAKCVESFANQSCENTAPSTNLLLGCEDVIVGKKAAGEDCPEGFECMPGLSCVNKKCTKLATTGEACGAETPCDKATYCDFQDKKCKARKKDGEDCSFGECADNLTCNNGKCGTSTTSTTNSLCQ